MSRITQQRRDDLFELTQETRAELGRSKYYNDDLAPTTVGQRNWKTGSICNLWIGMAICIPSLSVASSLIILGVSPLLSILNVIQYGCEKRSFRQLPVWNDGQSQREHAALA